MLKHAGPDLIGQIFRLLPLTILNQCLALCAYHVAAEKCYTGMRPELQILTK